MKRKLLIASLLVIVIASLAAGTLAYFNAEGTAHNVITSGNVKIKIQEWANEDKTEPFENMEGLMPDTSVTKIAEVKNVGGSEAWIRVKITKNIELTEQGTPDAELLVLDLNTKDWKLGKDGYYYYQSIVKPGGVTEPIFTTVTFHKTMGNEYQNATATVALKAQAVQVAHNGDSAMSAKGWPAEPEE